jgi:hypothetical protein
MRLGVLRSAIITLALSLASAAPLFAQSQTSLSGAISGRELCAQDMCGSAIFAAVFVGQIDHRPTVGLAIGSIRHTSPLPTDPGQCADITGGSWSISTLRGTLAGSIESTGGKVCSIDGVKYTVRLTMDIDQGGDGTANLNVLLDHQPFPPTVNGTISQ